MSRRSPFRSVPAPGPRLRPVTNTQTITCTSCKHRSVTQRWEEQLRVCGNCGHHGAVGAALRCTQLADGGSLAMQQFDDIGERDFLKFNDGIPYTKRLAAARDKTGLDEAFAIARASINGMPAVLACMDFGFLGGSLGSAAGELFVRGCELAVAEQRAMVAVCSSGGARMQEGIVSLAQMARCSSGVSMVSAARLPYVSVLADPCFGGVTASFAVQADVILAEPRARIGFAGGRVIEQATYDKLPDGFQTSEFLLEHGMIDAVVERGRLRTTLATMLSALMSSRDAS